MPKRLTDLPDVLANLTDALNRLSTTVESVRTTEGPVIIDIAKDFRVLVSDYLGFTVRKER